MGEVIGLIQNIGETAFRQLRWIKMQDIETDVDLEQKGFDDGHGNTPPAAALSMSMLEKQVLQKIETHIHEIEEFASRDKAHSYRTLERLDISEIDDGFTDLVNETQKDIKVTIADAKPKLEELRIEERRAIRNLNHFKAVNKLKRDAVYPESHIYHLSIISVFLLFECFGNMYFFAEGSNIGYLGGFFQAALVSVVNVGVSYLIGWFALAQMNHADPFRRWLGRLALIAYGLIMLIFHFAVAHYRDLLTIDPDHAALEALNKLRGNFFGLETIDSVLVLLMGVVIALISCYKGYKHDDHYPGFGSADREYQKRLAAYREAINEIRTKVTTAITVSRDKVNGRLQEYQANVEKYKETLADFKIQEENYKNAIKNATRILQMALDKYRESNKAVRTDKAPEYFRSYPELTTAIMAPGELYDSKIYQDRQKEIQEKFKELRKQATHMLGVFSKLIEEVGQEIDRVEAIVDKQASEHLNSRDSQQHAA